MIGQGMARGTEDRGRLLENNRLIEGIDTTVSTRRGDETPQSTRRGDKTPPSQPGEETRLPNGTLFSI